MVYRLSLSFSQLILLACALFVLFIYEQDKNGELIAFLWFGVVETSTPLLRQQQCQVVPAVYVQYAS